MKNIYDATISIKVLYIMSQSIIANKDLNNITITTGIPSRKTECLEKGEAYKGVDVNFLVDGKTQWGTTYVGIGNLKKFIDSEKREIKFKIKGEELEQLVHLQTQLIETIRSKGESFGVDTDEEDCVGKKLITLSEDESEGTLTLKLKPMTKFYSVDRKQYDQAGDVQLADVLLGNPNTKVAVYFQPNGAYVLDGVAHLSAVVNQIRILDTGVLYVRMDFEQLIDYTDTTDPNLPNYNLIGMDKIDREKISFSFTSPMGSLFKKNVLYNFKGNANKFLITQTDFGFTFGIELSSKDDPGSKKVIKIYNPVSDEQSNTYYEGLNRVYEVLNENMCSGEYRSIIGKSQKKNTVKGKEIKPSEGYTGATRRLYNGFSGSCKANMWTEKTVRDGAVSFLNKISLKIPTNDDNVPTVPVFDEDGNRVDVTLLEERSYFSDKMVAAVFQVNGVWISKATGFGLMTSVKQLHVRARGGGGGGTKTASNAGSEYITFDNDPEVITTTDATNATNATGTNDATGANDATNATDASELSEDFVNSLDICG